MKSSLVALACALAMCASVASAATFCYVSSTPGTYCGACDGTSAIYKERLADGTVKTLTGSAAKTAIIAKGGQCYFRSSTRKPRRH